MGGWPLYKKFVTGALGMTLRQQPSFKQPDLNEQEDK